MSDDARPVLMSHELIDKLDLRERMVGYDLVSGVVRVTEAELLDFGASRVEWGEPDAHGYYTPTLYADTTNMPVVEP